MTGKRDEAQLVLPESDLIEEILRQKEMKKTPLSREQQKEIQMILAEIIEKWERK